MGTDLGEGKLKRKKLRGKNLNRRKRRKRRTKSSAALVKVGPREETDTGKIIDGRIMFRTFSPSFCPQSFCQTPQKKRSAAVVKGMWDSSPQYKGLAQFWSWD